MKWSLAISYGYRIDHVLLIMTSWNAFIGGSEKKKNEETKPILKVHISESSDVI